MSVRQPSIAIKVSRLACLLICLCWGAAAAKEVQRKLPSGAVAVAEYLPGDSQLPAVVVLHGFLQTHHFATVANLANALADEGYTVLAPTLSLHTSHRKRSLPCEAAHTHSMADDLQELAHWLDWLEQQGARDIVLVGHSYGSLQWVLYMAQRPRPSVRAVIATSLVDVEHTVGVALNQRQLARAQARVAEQNQGLDAYHLSYCRRYMSPPQAFISYAEWSKERIITQLKKVRVPVSVIVGGKDDRMDQLWPERLAQSGVQVITVAGANHFFNAEFEFDLFEHVLTLLQRFAPPATAP